MTVSKNVETGQVTLMHLFLAIVFFMPVAAVTSELERAGSGMLRYLIAVPLALVLGALIVSLDWTIGKAVWLRSQRSSERAQNAVAIGLLAAELLWIIVGTVSGFKLAAFVAKHFAR